MIIRDTDRSPEEAREIITRTLILAFWKQCFKEAEVSRLHESLSFMLNAIDTAGRNLSALIGFAPQEFDRLLEKLAKEERLDFSLDREAGTANFGVRLGPALGEWFDTHASPAEKAFLLPFATKATKFYEATGPHCDL